MKKYIWMVTAIIISQLPTFSQTNSGGVLDSLYGVLPHLKDSNRVDCLIALAEKSGYPVGKSLDFKSRVDSLRFYAELAYEESKRIDYKKGLMQAAVRLCRGEFQRGFDSNGYPVFDDPSIYKGMDKYLSIAIPIGEKYHFYEDLGEAYSLKSILILKLDGKQGFTKAEPFKRKAIYNFELGGNYKMAAEEATWLTFDYLAKGYYESGLDICEAGLRNAQRWKPVVPNAEMQEWKNYLVQQSLQNMSEIYQAGGDYVNALNYQNLIEEYKLANNAKWPTSLNKAEIFLLSGELDSAIKYHAQEASVRKDWVVNYVQSEILLKQEKFKEALPILLRSLDSA
ncbi:MAG TPA: hypothetical protein VM101_13410, partial [Flavitalea sp.]|nr:hypothetical protein [Flavitalea sp.]